jgi:Gpi18-like mannosyltransferase
VILVLFFIFFGFWGRAVKAVVLGIHGPALTYFSGICGTKFSKKEVFSKNRGLAAFVQATAWQAASVTAAFSP